MKTIAIGCNGNGETFTVTAEETPTVTAAQLAELRQKLIAESQRRINMRNGMRAVAEAIHEKHRWLFAPEPMASASHDERQYIIGECGAPLTVSAIHSGECGECKRSIFAHPVSDPMYERWMAEGALSANVSWYSDYADVLPAEQRDNYVGA